MPMPDYIRALREIVGHDLLLLCTAAAIVFNEAGEVLLQQRSDDGHWALPGGMIEPGEEPAETVVREVREETGLDVIPVRLVGVYGGPENMGSYPNGDQFAIINIAFECEVVEGVLTVADDESLAVRYFALDALPETLYPKHRKRIEHAVNGPSPYFAQP